MARKATQPKNATQAPTGQIDHNGGKPPRPRPQTAYRYRHSHKVSMPKPIYQWPNRHIKIKQPAKWATYLLFQWQPNPKPKLSTTTRQLATWDSYLPRKWLPNLKLNLKTKPSQKTSFATSSVWGDCRNPTFHNIRTPKYIRPRRKWRATWRTISRLAAKMADSQAQQTK